MIKTTIQQAKMIFVYMLKHPQYLLQIGKDFFEQDDLQYIAMTARQFYKEYKEVPSCEQMKMIVKNEDKDNIKPETIESYYHVDIDPMDKEWLKSTTEGWIKYRTLMSNFSKAATLIKTSAISLETWVLTFLMLIIIRTPMKTRFTTLGISGTRAQRVDLTPKH